MDPTYKESEFHHPEHSDADELRNIARIYEKVREGGEWWKKVPRRIKRHASFEPVYSMIEMLIDTEKKKSAPESTPEKLIAEVDRLNKLLETER